MFGDIRLNTQQQQKHNNNNNNSQIEPYLIVPSAQTQPVHITASLTLSLTSDTPIAALAYFNTTPLFLCC